MLQRSKRRRSTLFLVALACLVTEVRGQVTSCLPPNAVSPGVHPSQPRVPDSLRVKVEMTEEGRNATRQLELIFDGQGNRALLTDMDNNTLTTVHFLYATQEIIYIKGAQCTVKNMSADPGRFVLFGDPVTDELGHIPDGATALYFGQNIAKVYNGRKTVRGIECDWWHTCISAPFDPHQNLSIDYYFSVKTWTTPSLSSPAPIRYEVTDTQSLNNGTVDTRRYVLDFFDFIQDMDSDPSVFETPEGVVCSGRMNTKAMPALPSRYFHFQEEMVDLYYGRITHTEIWYDLVQKLVRVDCRSPDIAPPLYTTDPVSVIHDYGYGVSYVKDVDVGECTPMALATNSFDGRLNTAALRISGSLVMSMKPPASFFFLDSNFTYSGQRFTRNAMCDVYISHRDDFDVYNNGSALEATVEVYFLAEGWKDFSKDSPGQVLEQFPLRVQVWIPKLNKNVRYNIFDFDTSQPDVSIFDVTDCFDDSSSLILRVRFQGGGQYYRDSEHEVLVNGQNSLASVMRVSPLRVNHLQLQYDASFLYVVATLLDRTPSLAQFTHLPKAVIEKDDDLAWSQVDSVATCSDYCVSNPDFTCLSFQFCPNERGGTCRFSRRHVSDGKVSVGSGSCDLYSRTVNVVSPPELTAKEAYYQLKDTINKQMLYFQIIEDNEEEMNYLAVDVEMLFGRLEDVSLPSLIGQFSYRVEMVFPRVQRANAYDVWYDSVSKLARVDIRDPMAGPPYYTPFTVSSIHDYNTGISYDVDMSGGNCTVARIPANKTFDGQAVNWTEVSTTGRYVLTMKTPQQLMHLDNSYNFTGQKTIRGILCDVFESKRTDFSVGSGTQHSIFQYFWQSKNRRYESDTRDDITNQQPVQLVISDEKANAYIIYNFYDYNDEHTTYDMFNIAPCFTDDQRIDIVLDFNRTYHPYLDNAEWLFKQEVVMRLSEMLHVSPVRLQNVRVTYKLDQTFVIFTLLGQVAPQLHFVEAGTSSMYKTRVVVPESTVEGCAATCFNSHDLVCNSFDLCADMNCYLSSRHVPDGNATKPDVKCRHFSRLTDGTTPEASTDDAYTGLKDLVFKGLLTVILSTERGDQQISFTAVGVRDDIFQLTPPTETGAEDLHGKFRLYKTGSRLSDNALLVQGQAVDDCAASCFHQDQFVCQAFSYCYSSGDCLLSANRPALNPSLLSPAPLCDVYSRLYLDDFIQYQGLVMEVTEDGTTVPGLLRPEDCARHCSLYTSFACRSFDFCPSTRHCLLRRGHVLDYRPATSNTSLCSHYSRNYLVDFAMYVRKAVTTGSDDLAVSNGVNVQTCALRCGQETSCQSFEFCSGQCRLSSLLPTPEVITDSNDCDLYISTGGSAPIIPADTTSTTTSSSRSPGSPSPGHRTVSPGAHSSSTSRSTDSPSPGPSSRSPASHATTSQAAVSPGGCSVKQKSDVQSDDTGVRVGIGVGVLVLGIVLGVVLALLGQRLRGRRGSDDSLELVPRLN